MALSMLATQTAALVRKGLLLHRRKWLYTVLSAYVLPVLALMLLLNVGNLGPSMQLYGIGDAAPVASLRSSLGQPGNGGDLVIVAGAAMGADVGRVVQQLRQPLADLPGRVVQLDSAAQMRAHCAPNLRGLSGCHAVLAFDDSPLTAGGSASWNYSLLTDMYRLGGNVGVHDHANYAESTWLPLQLAVDNAIANASTPLAAFGFTYDSQREVDDRRRRDFLTVFISIFLITFFLPYLPIIYHAVNAVSTDRDLGMSHLVDAMGGGAGARVAASVVTLNLVYLPTWIVFGAVYWHYVFPESNAAILLLWSVLAGVAMTNASVFAAAFFTNRYASSVLACTVFLVLAIVAAVQINQFVGDTTVLVCSLLFPSMNFMFGLCRMSRFAIGLSPIDLAAKTSPGQTAAFSETYYIAVWVFWVFLAVQIIAYPLLAVLAERAIHGISFRRRTLAESGASEDPWVAVRTTQLRKVYRPSIWRAMFCCAGSSKNVKAVDGLDLVAHKNQILCLLGVNGSGKTTTLDLIAGTQASSGGDVVINAPSTKLGICPQRNILHPLLTVYEHVKFWSELKGGREDDAALRRLIDACNLTGKTYSRAGSLSGGQKRKLQLACMFVGGSTVCLMDEVTTGLDPLSRRVIWDIILAERSKRTMLFTTHFLDEGEVLADHVVLLSKGNIKCQGSVAELKNQFGGGYLVHIPRSDRLPDLDIPATVHQDRIVYNTPDSRSAGQLIARLEQAGHAEIALQGPTIESVFLRLTTDVDDKSAEEGPAGAAPSAARGTLPAARELASGRPTSSFAQIRALVRKRFTVLPRYWIAPLLALFIPCFVPSQLKTFLDRYETPVCDKVQALYDSPSRVQLSLYASPYTAKFPVGPPSANESLWKVMQGYPIASGFSFSPDNYDQQFDFLDSFDSFHEYIGVNSRRLDNGGVYAGDSSHPATIAFQAPYGVESPLLMANLWANMRSSVPIGVSYGPISYVDYFSSGQEGFFYVVFAVFVFAVYPAFFALYPAFEKTHKIRALQYANGVRPFPLWMSHLLFDFLSVLVVSGALTATIIVQFSDFWFAPAYMFAVSCLYGLAMLLVSYLVARVSGSQLSAFLGTFGVMMLMFVVTILAFVLPPSYTAIDQIEQTTDGLSFGLGLILPPVNLWKAFAVGINLYKVLCRSTELVTKPASIYAYGGPIMLLTLQVVFFTLLLIWLESSRSFGAIAAFFRRLATARSSSTSVRKADEEGGFEFEDGGITKEAARVEANESDLLLLRHVTKRFGGNTAVDDVSLGLGQGEILALLGPNGAGKTTIANMIMGELPPDSGHIFLRGVDVERNTRLAQMALGVCPQFDALDLMTARQHLEFYARIRGVPNPRANADALMHRVGLAPHADKAAAKLSGGNKRKLSLAIALVGNPDVLILDEPSSAMDAAAKRVMWKLLADIAPGRSVLLTTHSMEEADALATRAAIISKRLLAIGTTEVLRQRYSNLYHVTLILCSAPESSTAEMRAVEDWVCGRFAGAVLEGHSLGGQVRFVVPNSISETDGARSGGHKNSIGRIIETLESEREHLGLHDYAVGAPTLERVFLSVVKENGVEEEEDSGKTGRARWRCW